MNPAIAKLRRSVRVGTRVTLGATAQGWAMKYSIWRVVAIDGHLYELVPDEDHPQGAKYLAVLPDILFVMPEDSTGTLL